MRFPTGLAAFDVSTCGGFPAGVVELAGPDSSGKTTVALSCMREAGTAGLPCALIYMQGAAPDTDFIRTAGNPDTMVVRPTTGESALHAAHVCLQRGVRVVVIDSVANVRPGREDTLPMGEVDFGAARMLYHGLHALQREAWKRDSLVLLTNEIRARQGGRRNQTISAYESVLPFVTDMRVRIARTETTLEYGELAEVVVRLTVASSSTTLPGTTAVGRLFGATGVDRGRELLELMIERGVFVRTGAYWKGRGDVLGPGYRKAAQQVEQRYQHYWEVLRDDGD
jgi:recombination protein RecA